MLSIMVASVIAISTAHLESVMAQGDQPTNQTNEGFGTANEVEEMTNSSRELLGNGTSISDTNQTGLADLEKEQTSDTQGNMTSADNAPF